MEQLAKIIYEQKIEIDALKTKQPVTKGDLITTKLELQKEIEVIRREIADLRYDTLKFIVWTGIAVVITLGGMLVKGFHWL